MQIFSQIADHIEYEFGIMPTLIYDTNSSLGKIEPYLCLDFTPLLDFYLEINYTDILDDIRDCGLIRTLQMINDEVLDAYCQAQEIMENMEDDEEE